MPLAEVGGAATPTPKRMSSASLSRLSEPKHKRLGGGAEDGAGGGRPVHSHPTPGRLPPIQLTHPRLKRYSLGNGVVEGHNDMGR